LITNDVIIVETLCILSRDSTELVKDVLLNVLITIEYENITGC